MRSFLIAVGAVILAAASAVAGWSQTAGPIGGTVNCIATNAENGHLFAGTNGGVYRSDDGGASWRWLGNGMPPNTEVNALAAAGSRIFAGAGNEGAIYYSGDEGASWSKAAGSGLPSMLMVAYSLLVTPTKVFAGVSGIPSGGIFWSTDNGAHWTAATVPSNFFPGVIVKSGANLFAGGGISSTTKGMCISTDDGATWSAVNNNFPTSAAVTGLASIGSAVFAGTLTGGVFRTTNNGAGWEKISTTVANGFSSALIAAGSDLYIASDRIYKADASGANWQPVVTGLPLFNAGTTIRAMAAANAGIVLSYNDFGIYRTTDNGGSWQRSNSGLINSRSNGILHNGSTLYASSSGTGFFKSTDNGDTWAEINEGVNFVNSSSFGRIIAAGPALIGLSSGLLYRSTNGGSTWTPASGISGGIYACIADGDALFASGQGFVSKSTDNGATWSPLNTGFTLIQGVFALLKDGDVMVAAGTAGFKRSTDGGTTWTAPIAGLSSILAYSSIIRVNADLYLLGSGNGVHTSTDKGASWKASALAGSTVHALIAAGGQLYAGTSTGMYRSTDNGTTWIVGNVGLPPGVTIKSLFMTDNYLFAGTQNQGVWRRPFSEVLAVQESRGAEPEGFTLRANYPNPFNPQTNIGYRLPVAAHVRVSIVTLLGQEIATLVNEVQNAGEHTVVWDAGNHPSGLYFYRMEATAPGAQRQRFSQTGKMALVR